MENEQKSKVVIEVCEGKEIEVNVTKAQLEIVEKKCRLARTNFYNECKKIEAEFSGAWMMNDDNDNEPERNEQYNLGMMDALTWVGKQLWNKPDKEKLEDLEQLIYWLVGDCEERRAWAFQGLVDSSCRCMTREESDKETVN